MVNRYPVLSVGSYNRFVVNVLTFKKATVMKAKSRTGSISLGRHIVVDSRICHGKPAFRGTRVLVSDVLEQVATGMSWDAIIAEWNENLTKEAITEAVALASEALIRHSDEFTLEPVSA